MTINCCCCCWWRWQSKTGTSVQLLELFSSIFCVLLFRVPNLLILCVCLPVCVRTCASFFIVMLLEISIHTYFLGEKSFLVLSLRTNKRTKKIAVRPMHCCIELMFQFVWTTLQKYWFMMAMMSAYLHDPFMIFFRRFLSLSFHSHLWVNKKIENKEQNIHYNWMRRSISLSLFL